MRICDDSHTAIEECASDRVDGDELCVETKSEGGNDEDMIILWMIM